MGCPTKPSSGSLRAVRRSFLNCDFQDKRSAVRSQAPYALIRELWTLSARQLSQNSANELLSNIFKQRTHSYQSGISLSIRYGNPSIDYFFVLNFHALHFPHFRYITVLVMQLQEEQRESGDFFAGRVMASSTWSFVWTRTIYTIGAYLHLDKLGERSANWIYGRFSLWLYRRIHR